MYGGTKSEMERLLADAQKLTGVEYNIDNLDDVFMAVHAIQEEIGITGTTALEAEETIGGSLNAMKAAFANTLGALAIGENIQGSFKALAETMSTFIFGNLLPMIGTIFQSLPTALIAFFQTAAPLLITEGGNLIAQLGNGLITAIPQLLMQAQILMSQLILWLREQFPTILANGVEFILNFANGFFEALPSVISNIGQILHQVLFAIITAIPSVLDAGYNLIVGLAEGIWSNYPMIVERITSIITGLLDTILERFPDIVRKGMELVGKLASGIWNNLPQIITTIGNLLTSVIGKIGGYLPKFLTQGLKLIGQLAIGIIKAIPGIVAKIPQVIRAIIGAFSNVGKQFFNIGADLIKGLWKGINSVKDWILGKIKGFVGGITGGIKKFFGIKSPSTVMADEVGQWIPAGLAEGIEDNVKPVTDAMNDLTDLTTGTMTSELAMTSSMSLANSTTGGIEVEKGINKQPVHLNLNIGGQVFRAFVENISNEQGKITDLELQF